MFPSPTLICWLKFQPQKRSSRPVRFSLGCQEIPGTDGIILEVPGQGKQAKLELFTTSQDGQTGSGQVGSCFGMGGKLAKSLSQSGGFWELL